MHNFAFLLITAIFFTPLIAGILNLVLKSTRRIIFQIVLGFVIASVFALSLIGDLELVTPLSFMGEAISFSLSRNPLLLFLALLIALFILHWHASPAKDPPNSSYILLCIGVSSGFIAFISGQFMIRYIALDVVGLVAALSVLTSFSDSRSVKRFTVIFQILRLGDLSLLAAILLINHYAGTLNISRMISSALEMPASAQMWALMGFLFAILIKLAIWPFDLWLRRVRQIGVGVSFWISGLLMPSLGYYLLYRIMPIISSQVMFQNLTLFVGLGLFSIYLVMSYLRVVKVEFFTLMTGVLGCFLLAAVSFGPNPDLIYYLLGLITFRFVLSVQNETAIARHKKLFVAIPLVLNVLFILMNLDHYPILFSVGWIGLTGILGIWFWKVLSQRISEAGAGATVVGSQPEVFSSGLLFDVAQWLNRVLENELFTSGFSRASRYFEHLAEWFYQNIERRLENGWAWVGQKLMAISQGTLRTLEVDTAEKTGELVNGALKSLETYEENILQKTLRLDLAWIPILLAVILILLFVI